MTADFPADIPANFEINRPAQSVSEAKLLLSRGLAHARDRQFEQAIPLFTQSINLKSQSATQPAVQLDTHPPTAQPPEIEELNAERLDTIVKSYYHRGCARSQARHYDEAIADFTQIIQLSNSLFAAANKLVQAYVHRGNAYRHLGCHELALVDLNEAIDLSNGSAQSYGYRGLLLTDMGSLEQAIADFDLVIERHPAFAQGYLWRGFAHLRRQQFETATIDLTRAIEAIPTCLEAYNHRGVARFYLGDFERSLSDFSQAIQIDNQSAEAYNNRANLYQLLGDNAAAMVDRDRAIALNPQLAELYFNRMATAALDDLAALDKDRQKTAGLSLHEAAFYRQWATADFQQKRFAAAIANYSKALAIAPTAYAHRHRGLSYLAIGELDAAAADFESAIALTPNHAATYGNRASLRFQTQDNQGALEDISKAASSKKSVAEKTNSKKAIAENINQSKLTSQRDLYATRCLIHFCLAATDPDRLRLALKDFEQLIALFESSMAESQSSSQTSNAFTSIGSSGVEA